MSSILARSSGSNERNGKVYNMGDSYRHSKSSALNTLAKVEVEAVVSWVVLVATAQVISMAQAVATVNTDESYSGKSPSKHP